MKLIELLQLLANGEKEKLPEAFWYKDLIFYKGRNIYDNDEIFYISNEDDCNLYPILDEISDIKELNTELKILSEEEVKTRIPYNYSDVEIVDTVYSLVDRLNEVE